MTESNKMKNDDDDGAGSPEGASGDVVESAGETTAAAAINGPTDTRPVGADTLAKVEGGRGGDERDE